MVFKPAEKKTRLEITPVEWKDIENPNTYSTLQPLYGGKRSSLENGRVPGNHHSHSGFSAQYNKGDEWTKLTGFNGELAVVRTKQNTSVHPWEYLSLAAEDAKRPQESLPWKQGLSKQRR